MMRLACGVLVLAACSSGSTKPSTTPPPNEPAPMGEAPRSPAEPPAPPTPPPPPPSDPKAELRAAELAAFEQAKPVFEKWCAACHSEGGKKQSAKKRDHFDMTTYPFGGHHAMDIHNEVRVVLGLTGKKPTMPADNKGAVKGEELALIKAWAEAFEAAHAGGAHEGHDGGHHH